MGRTSDARDRLLHSARDLIRERGYHDVGVSEICAAAGVNKGSFYHFFSSKQQLALDLIESLGSCAADQLDVALATDGAPLERLRRHLEGVYAAHRGSCAADGRQLGCTLGNLALELSAEDPALRKALAATFEQQIERYEVLLADAPLRDGLTARSASEALLALLEGKILLSKVRDDPEILADLPDLALAAIAG